MSSRASWAGETARDPRGNEPPRGSGRLDHEHGARAVRPSHRQSRSGNEYFQRGIVEPFDDFRSTNRATHPALLDGLARYFIDSGFRFKALHRLILNSKTYQLSAHVPGRPGGERPLEDALFARYLPRKLPAEVLLDAISRVTGVAEEFNNYPAGTSPKELIASIGATHFLTTFGHPRRDIMEARSNAPSLAQALQMMNGDVLARRMAAEGFVLDTLLRQGLSDGAIIDTLYGTGLRAHSRGLRAGGSRCLPRSRERGRTKPAAGPGEHALGRSSTPRNSR